MASIGTSKSSLAIGFAFPIVSGICVALRFYSRWHLKNELRIDDWLCLPAWACVTGTLHDSSLQADSNAEQHFTAQILGALAIFWAFANTLIKLSILFFYRRMFRGRWFDICTRVLIGLCLVWLIYDTLGWLLFCGTDLHANFEGPWDNCPLWGFQLQIGVFALDSFLDLCILLIPIPLVWKLQLDNMRKAFVLVIFLLGGFAFFAGLSNTIVQGVFLVQPSFAEDAGGGSFFHGASFLIYNWPTVEVGVGLIACNLPSLSVRVLASLPQRLSKAWRSSLETFRARTSRKTSSLLLSDPRGISYDAALDLEAMRTNESSKSRLDVPKSGMIYKSVSVEMEQS